MGRREEVYEAVLRDKKISLLILDNNWHKLFSQTDTTQRVLVQEGKLNDLLKRQGKINNETAKIKKLKKRLMDEIISLAYSRSQSNESSTDKKLDEIKRLIADCNNKLEKNQEELLNIADEITKTNYQLMITTMDVCYETLHGNTVEIDKIDKWIAKIKEELKQQIFLKRTKEKKIRDLYNYMHAIFGVEVMNIFDLKYIPNDKKKKVNKQKMLKKKNS